MIKKIRDYTNIKPIIVIISGFIILCGMYSCQKEKSSKHKTDEAYVPPTPKKFGDTDAVALVNGEKITWKMLKQFLPPDIESMPVAEQEQLRKRYLNRMISQLLVYQEAVKTGITATNEEVEAAIGERMKTYPDPDDFYRDLEKNNISLEDLRESEKYNLILNRMLEIKMDEKAPTMEVDDKRIKEYYEEQKDTRFKIPGTGSIHLSWILVRCSANAIPEERKIAKEKTSEVLHKLQKGSDFGTMARYYSEDPSSNNDGDLGNMAINKMNKDLVENAENMKPGEYSDIIELPETGFAIIKLHSYSPPEYKSLNEVKENIEKHLQHVDSRGGLAVWIAILRQKSDVQTFL